MSVKSKPAVDIDTLGVTPAAIAETNPLSMMTSATETPPAFAAMALFGCDMMITSLRTWRQIMDANREAIRLQQSALLDSVHGRLENMKEKLSS